jgi:hypothetical protein
MLAAAFVVVAVIVAATAQAGAWWVPFAAGAGAGLAALRWRPRRGLILLATVAGAVAGWGLPLWILSLRGFPAGATARVIAATAGLPPYAAVMVVLTLLLAALQVLAGTWLARAVAAVARPAPDGELAPPRRRGGGVG